MTPIRSGRVYRLARRLAECRGGDVWTATLEGPAGFSRAVAVKRVADDEPDLAARLRDEARMLACVSHPAVVRVEDLVEVEPGDWAIVLELVDGVDLDRLVRATGPVPARAAADLAVQVGFGLAAVHDAIDPRTARRAGLVHRDVQPANVILTPTGDARLVDFGAARSDTPREGETRSVTWATPAYMAPERHDGVAGPPCDVYGLGAVLVYLVTGADPPECSVHPARHAQRIDDATAALGPVRDVVRAMLAYEPARRPSARDAARSLRDRLPMLPGPWVEAWAPDALASIEEDTEE